MIDSHALKCIEFSKIIKELLNYCFSPSGRERLGEEQILTDENEVFQLQERTRAMHSHILQKEKMPDTSFPEMESVFKYLSIHGYVLDLEQFLALRLFLESVKKIHGFLKDSETETIKNLQNEIPDLSDLFSMVKKFISEKGEIRESNVPELKKISSRIQKLRKDVEKSAHSYIQNPDYSGYWQNDRPTLRDGRLVLPLKANYKGKISGIIHEISATGNTVYIEPDQLVRNNNSLFELQKEYQAEVHRLLKRLTSNVADKLSELQHTDDVIAEIDSLYARARYAVIHTCTMPKTGGGTIELYRVRHPLLGRSAVPISIEIPESTRAIIITGPNTGGKTVSIKTVALMAAMHQFGMGIPADEGCRLPVFSNIFADIGDEQSLEQSLSTFSGHMANISKISDNADSESLVLLDELGAGTDPEEGSALAMAILDYLLDKKAYIVATTHHGILKNYGYAHDLVQNASVDFNTEKLEPTYRIITGIPGKSYALDIAGRYGLNKDIIETARSYLDEERTDVGKLVQNLGEKHKELLDKEKEHQKRENKLREKQRETDLEKLRLRQREAELRENGVSDLKSLLFESRKQLENLIRELREEGVTRERTKRVKNFITELQDNVEKEEKRIPETEPDEIEKEYNEKEISLTEGSEVKIKGLSKTGRAVKKVKKDKWLVETDTMRLTIDQKELIPIHSEKKGNKQTKNNTLQTGENADFEVMSEGISAGGKPSHQIDIRGYRVEEAKQKLQDQLDKAVLHGLTEFAVIHGKGDGILQNMVHNYLKGSDAVERFDFSMPEQGGFGRTVVKLK